MARALVFFEGFFDGVGWLAFAFEIFGQICLRSYQNSRSTAPSPVVGKEGKHTTPGHRL